MLLADRGHDHGRYQRMLWQRRIRPAIAERGRPHGTGLGISRWVVERTISWLHGFRVWAEAGCPVGAVSGATAGDRAALSTKPRITGQYSPARLGVTAVKRHMPRPHNG
ncbi:hypothetical protein [Streptomyces flaveolus]|uniref:hypothetical protein n=1 Tax=Streptomyces flaveolus TaxID=67297 RepID=UPI003F55D937